MKRQTPRKASDVAPTIIINAEGHRVALVPVQGSDRSATMYADWYEAKKAEGWSMCLRLCDDGKGNAYVKLWACTPRGHARALPVSRLAAGAMVNERVRARDGDPLNLLPENLETYHGFARYAVADWYPNVGALRAAGIEPTEANMGIRKPKKATHSAPIEANKGQAGEHPERFSPQISVVVSDDRTRGHHPPYPLRPHSSAPGASPVIPRSS